MLGHLIIDHFDENVKALEIIDYVVSIILEFALKEKFFIIVTSDHGNVDEYSSSHSLNKVITTFIPPKGRKISLTKRASDCIRLFDIPWAICEIFDISKDVRSLLPEIPGWLAERGLVGEVPIKIESE